MRTIGSLMLVLLAVGCAGGSSTENDGEGPDGGGEGDAGPHQDPIPDVPQDWVEILGPGQSIDDENADGDGWCVGGENPVACDDGAPPGSGGRTPDAGHGSSGGTSSGTPGSSSSGGHGGGPGMCTVQDFTTGAHAVPQMLLVVDKSGSMQEIASDGVSKWAQIAGTLETVTSSLESRIDFGLSLFPAGGEGSCSGGSVVVPVGVQHAAAISSTLDGVFPAGGTPTAESLSSALAYMRTLDHARPRVVVLATDGAPNCRQTYDPGSCVCTSASCQSSEQCLDRNGAISSVDALTADGVSTFVVGIPGTDAFSDTLNAMAHAGGTELPPGNPTRYYRTTNAQDLRDALDAITTRVSTCRFELDAPVDENQPMEVRVDGNGVSHDPTHSGGWDVSNGNVIELYGAACQALADGSGHAVSVRYCAGFAG